MAFTLFGTDGCHLCEDADRLLQQATTLLPVTYRYEDIANDDRLVERYGIRIPVIRHDGSCDELGWPFDFAHLLSWLTVHHSPEKEN
ncbi:glutaredoxin family protein [Oceanobacter antarcticus]|jgi:glutaredoxin|uniref:Glutaredoxin family protein n=1 Tax=Oceanobacter antarcticus TaxID=3133425 RepID=A0ABW8NGR6_9GAMM